MKALSLPTTPQTATAIKGRRSKTLTILLLLLWPLWLLCACSQSDGGGPSPITTAPTPVVIEQAQASIAQSDGFLVKLAATLQAATAASWESMKPLALSYVESARASLATATQHTEAAKTSSEKDVKAGAAAEAKVTKLEQADPVKRQFEIWGGVGLAVAIAALIAGIWFNIAILRTLAAALGVASLLLLTVAAFLHTLEWIIVGCLGVAVVAGLVWLALHWKVVRDRAAQAMGDIPSASLADMANLPTSAKTIFAGIGPTSSVTMPAVTGVTASASTPPPAN